MIFRWLKERKERSREDEVDRGFSWVMLRYYRYKEPTYYIADSIFGVSNDFREGARMALNLLPDINEEWGKQQ